MPCVPEYLQPKFYVQCTRREASFYFASNVLALPTQ